MLYCSFHFKLCETLRLLCETLCNSPEMATPNLQKRGHWQGHLQGIFLRGWW